MSKLPESPDLSKRRKPQPPPPAPDSAEVVASWDQPFLENSTQISPEHRKLLHHFEAETGKSMWQLIAHAIENTYGSKH